MTLSVYKLDEDHVGIVCRDDTERKKSEAALLASEQRAQDQLVELEAIYENAPVGIKGEHYAGNSLRERLKAPIRRGKPPGRRLCFGALALSRRCVRGPLAPSGPHPLFAFRHDSLPQAP